MMWHQKEIYNIPQWCPNHSHTGMRTVYTIDGISECMLCSEDANKKPISSFFQDIFLTPFVFIYICIENSIDYLKELNKPVYGKI